jgi:hypothetical protein
MFSIHLPMLMLYSLVESLDIPVLTISEEVLIVILSMLNNPRLMREDCMLTVITPITEWIMLDLFGGFTISPSSCCRPFTGNKSHWF